MPEQCVVGEIQVAHKEIVTARIYAERADISQSYPPAHDGPGNVVLELRDREIVLSPAAFQKFTALEKYLHSNQQYADLHGTTWRSSDVVDAIAEFERAGLVFAKSNSDNLLSGAEFYDTYFAPVLPRWLDTAFSHPFWAKMQSGAGSARLFAGWLFELYHFTKNANRHMPLATACARDKQTKTLLAKHYVEEWNHYHYFQKALAEMGFEDVAHSLPLPMTWEMSNFMREAARVDILAYCACSAVLEGTTIDKDAYERFYQKIKVEYGIPESAIKPIYDHLALDEEYGHSNLFRDICVATGEMTFRRAGIVMTYARMMIEHIWMWTDNIERYYGGDNPVPRTPFTYGLD